MKLSPGRAIAISLGCGLASTTWSLLVHALMVQLHNRVEYFLVGPSQVLIIGAALVPLVLATICLLLTQPRPNKYVAALGLAAPALFTLVIVCARLFE